jgi:hypothetical protein
MVRMDSKTKWHMATYLASVPGPPSIPRSTETLRKPE